MLGSERQGLLLALAGFSILSVGDSVIKTMAGEWSPLAVGALRFAIGAIGLSILLFRFEGPAGFRPANPWLQLGRGICLGMASLLFFSAIYVMPLAEAMSIALVAPVITAVLSGPLLGEKPRPAVWIASLLAMVGVALVLRPNLLAIGWAAFLPLCAATFFSLMVIANRASAGQGSPLSMQVYMAVVATPVLAIAAIGGALSGEPLLAVGWPEWHVVLRCVFVAVTASTAHWLVFLGTTRAGASSVAPMTYSQLLVASFMGWLLFDDLPDAMTLVGAAVIVVAGLYLWNDGRMLASGRDR